MVKILLVTLVCSRLQAQDNTVYHPYKMVDGVSTIDKLTCFKLSKSNNNNNNNTTTITKPDLYLVDCATGKQIKEKTKMPQTKVTNSTAQTLPRQTVETRLTTLEVRASAQLDAAQLTMEIIASYRSSAEMLIQQMRLLTAQVQELQDRITVIETALKTGHSLNGGDKLPQR